ncbi:MAG TPA: shikimate kinase, partial [Flavisolibacter sp.]|nr:shikimate kinase [Flavisolibacter sp.]
FLIGFMGSGKSHWGIQLSNKINIPFFDLDEKITETEGKPINKIFEVNGEEYFRRKEKEVLHMLTEQNKTFVMACGGGTPCFYNNIEFLKKNGIVVWLNCSTESLYKRLLKEKDRRPLISKIPDIELKSYIIKKYSSRKIYYQQANIIINEENLSLDMFVSQIFHN